jgi:hypothetical protein
VFAVVSLLFILGVFIYGARVRLSAQALLDSASEIHSTIDAERQIAAWRDRSGRDFQEVISPDGRDHSYDIQIENDLLHRLRLVPPTMIGLSIIMRNGELHSIIVVMSSGRPPTPPSGVWIQEWFDSNTDSGFHVISKDKPWKATVDFGAATPLAKRKKAFAMNSGCFVHLGGCRSAEDILPGVWQLD